MDPDSVPFEGILRRMRHEAELAKVYLYIKFEISTFTLRPNHTDTTPTPHQHHTHTTPTPHPHHTNTTPTPHFLKKVVVLVWCGCGVVWCWCGVGVVWVWFGRRLSVVCQRNFQPKMHQIQIAFGDRALWSLYSARETRLRGAYIVLLASSYSLILMQLD